MRRLGIVVLVLGVGSACASSSRRAAIPASEPAQAVERTVGWAELLAGLEASICIRTFVPDEGPAYTLGLYADNCESTESTTALSEAIELAWAEATPFLISLEDVDRAVQEVVHEGPVSDDMLARIRAIYLAEPFLRALVPRLERALAAQGLQCRDCPRFDPPPEIRVTWDELAPYVMAYIWPDPIVTPRAESGEISGEPRHSIHVCGGFNGVSELVDPDPLLLQAGFLAAFHADPIHARATALYKELRSEPAFTELRDDDARTRFARARLGVLLRADEAVRPAACEVLERFRPDLGLVVEGCP